MDDETDIEESDVEETDSDYSDNEIKNTSCESVEEKSAIEANEVEVTDSEKYSDNNKRTKQSEAWVNENKNKKNDHEKDHDNLTAIKEEQMIFDDNPHKKTCNIDFYISESEIEDDALSLTNSDCEDNVFELNDKDLEVDLRHTNAFKVKVKGTRHENGKKQVYDKHDVCLFCKKSFLSTSFSKHLIRQHSNEKKVLDILSYEDGNSERKRLFQLLRNEGNFFHNQHVLKEGGNLIVVQRPTKDQDITNQIDSYRCCRDCLGFYSKAEAWRHKCPKVKSDQRNTTIKPRYMLAVTGKEMDVFFRKLRFNEVGCLIRHDTAILRFIQYELRNKGMSKYGSISNHARLLASFLLFLHEREASFTSSSFSDILKPEHCDMITKTIIRMFEYSVDDAEKITVKSPSSLIKLTQAIITVCKLLEVDYLKERNMEKRSMTKEAGKILKHEFKPLALNSHYSMKSSRSGLPEPLPTAEQIEKLILHLKQTLTKTDRCDEKIRILKESALCFIIVFNKRRSNEVAALQKDIWLKRREFKKSAVEEMQKLDETEQILVQSLELVYVKGKGRKYVPILFPPEVVPVIEWLAGKTEKYIFANDGAGHLRGNDALRNVCNEAAVPKENMSSTKFRKLTATALQVSCDFY